MKNTFRERGDSSPATTADHYEHPYAHSWFTQFHDSDCEKIMKMPMQVALGNPMRDKFSMHDCGNLMKNITPVTKPNGLLLLFVAGCIVIGIPFVTFHLEFRAFDTCPLMVAYQSMISLLIFVFLIFPIILLILFLIRRKRMHPLFRTFLVLLPALLFTAPGLVKALVSPRKPGVAFADRMGKSIPEDAITFKAWYAQGGGDSTYIFTFLCSRESIEKLLAANTFHPVENPPMLDPDVSTLYQVPIAGITLPKEWPQPKTWNGLEIHSADFPNGYLYLLTDAERTRVLILAGDT